MTTYGIWLEAQAGRGDDIGLAAKAWRDAAGSRPKASAIKTIANWLVSQGVEGLADDQVEPVMVAAATEYRAGKASAAAAALGAAVVPPGSSEPVLAALGRLEGKLELIWARIGPVVDLLAELGEERQAAEQAQDGLAGQLEAAEEAREAADELAAREAAQAPVVALYGRHVVPEPDWERLAEEGQPEADEAG